MISLLNNINALYRKVSQKLHALSRISQYLSQHKKRILFKTFIMSQFNFCPLIWMWHSRGSNMKINNIHKRALRAFGTDTITNLGPKIWKLAPEEINNASSLLVFKSRIKTWITDNCPCRLCKTFVKDLGFIEVFPNL